MTAHGGNIHLAAKETGIPVSRIIDFSASINPLGLPRTAEAAVRRHLKAITHYPEPHAEGLAAFIAGRLDFPREHIIIGNGSTELIYLIPRALRPETVLIAAPTFSEYAQACKTTGARVVSIPLGAEKDYDLDAESFIKAMATGEGRGKPCGMAFLCNPNNPTGRLIRKRDVLRIAEAAQEHRCVLVVDEAFIDYCPEESILGETGRIPSLIVLRSLTKFYALAGLRIGYGVFPPHLVKGIMRHKEPWTVNVLAAVAAVAALEDSEYQKASLLLMEEEKSFMEDGIRDLGIPFLPSSANYYLIELENAGEIVRSLRAKGILVRDCSSFEGLGRTYVRIAVKSRKENMRLLRELRSLCRDS